MIHVLSAYTQSLTSVAAPNDIAMARQVHVNAHNAIVIDVKAPLVKVMLL